MNHERQMPKVKLILMSSKQQMTHEELLEKGGVYEKLYQMQFHK